MDDEERNEEQEQLNTEQNFSEISEHTKRIEKRLAKNAMNNAKAKAEKKLKDKMKKKAEKAKKAKIISLIVKGIIAALPTIIIIILIIAIALSIIGVVTKVMDFFKADNKATEDYFNISSNGIEIKQDEVDEILKKLKEEGYDLEERYLKKCLEAEAATILPKTGNEGIQGTVEIRKTDSRNEQGTEESTIGNLLTYEEYNSFSSNPDGSHFSIDSSGNLVVATYTSNQESGGEHYTLSTISSYKSLVSQFRIPYTFLLDLYMVTQNPEFVYKLAEEIEKSKVVLTLQDTETTIHKEWEEEDDEGNTYTEESWERYNSLSPLITRADTIFYRKTMIYNNKVTVTTSGGDVTTTTTTNSYSQGPDQEPYFKSDEFKKILQKRYHANQSQTSAIIGSPYNSVVNVNASLLIKLFNQNVNNEIIIQQFQYMLYLMTGNDFGVTELEIDFTETVSFEQITIQGGGNILLEYLKAWEGHEGLSADGTKYKIGLVKGNRTVGYGIDLETSGEEPRFIAAGYDTSAGAYVDVSFVDGIMMEVLQERRGRVIKATATCSPPLTEQQIDSLTCISYQYGNLGNFVQMYNMYGNTESLRQNLKVNSYYPFIKGPENNGRAAANWKLFHEGIYTRQDGSEIVGLDSNMQTSSEIAKKVIELAKTKVGCSYVWGAKGPDTFDCSGFVYWLYKQVGITIPTSTSSYTKGNHEVSLDEIQPGDIVHIYGTERANNVGHVALYIGNNQVIEAQSSKTGVVLNTLDKSRYRRAFRYWGQGSSEIISSQNNIGNIPTDTKSVIKLNTAQAYQLVTGNSAITSHPSSSVFPKSKADSMMVTIPVKIRVWTTGLETGESFKNITVNKNLATFWQSFFQSLYDNAPKFVIDPNTLYGYSYRTKTGNKGSLSAHALGTAVDINPDIKGNEYGGHVYTEAEWNQLGESRMKYQTIYENSPMVKIAKEYSLVWGGSWNTKDAMHFSFVGDTNKSRPK